MNISGDAAEGVMRISLEGFEVLARLTGAGAKEIFMTIYAILKDNEKQSVGKTNLLNMMKNCKDIKIFSMPLRDLEKFTEESKKYGIKYCTLLDKENKSGDSIVDVMVRSEDAVKVNRIVERYNLAIADTALLRTETVPENEQDLTKDEEKKEEVGQQNDAKVSDEQIDDILGTKEDEKIVEEADMFGKDNGVSQPFLKEDNLSESSLKNKGVVKENEKVSVKKTLQEIKEKLNNNAQNKNTKETRKEKSKKNRKRKEKGVKKNDKYR